MAVYRLRGVDGPIRGTGARIADHRIQSGGAMMDPGVCTCQPAVVAGSGPAERPDRPRLLAPSPSSRVCVSPRSPPYGQPMRSLIRRRPPFAVRPAVSAPASGAQCEHACRGSGPLAVLFVACSGFGAFVAYRRCAKDSGTTDATRRQASGRRVPRPKLERSHGAVPSARSAHRTVPKGQGQLLSSLSRPVTSTRVRLSGTSRIAEYRPLVHRTRS